MTTEPPRVASTVLGVLSFLFGLVACGSGAGLDAQTLPAELRTPYQRFEARCSRCHSLSRPLSAPVNTVDHWEKYVARMRRMPGSGINEHDAALILEFLTYYTVVVRGQGNNSPAPVAQEPAAPAEAVAPLPQVQEPVPAAPDGPPEQSLPEPSVVETEHVE